MSVRALRFSLLLALAAGGTLALKAAVTDYAALDDQGRLMADLQHALGEGGYEVALRRHRVLDPEVLAARGACRLSARDGTAAYQFSDAFAAQAAPLANLRYSYRGAWYGAPPTVRSEAESYRQRALARLGIVTSRPALIAVADNGQCLIEAGLLSSVRVYPTRRNIRD